MWSDFGTSNEIGILHVQVVRTSRVQQIRGNVNTVTNAQMQNLSAMNMKKSYFPLGIVVLRMNSGAEIRATKMRKCVKITLVCLDTGKPTVTNVSMISLYVMERSTVKMVQTKRTVKRTHAVTVMLNVGI